MPRQLLAAAVAACALVTPATAGPPTDATYRGGCFLVVTNETTQLLTPQTDWWSGYIGAVVLTSSPTLGHNPVDADVKCQAYLNGTAIAMGLFSGTAVTAGTHTVGFTANIPPDVVTLCTGVKMTDAHAQVSSGSHCVGATVFVEAVPPSVLVAAQAFCDSIGDQTLCDVLKANRGRLLVAF